MQIITIFYSYQQFRVDQASPKQSMAEDYKHSFDITPRILPGTSWRIVSLVYQLNYIRNQTLIH